MELDFITAPGDGLCPAVLLTIGTRLKAQYLFNVPEGVSRFVLEHKIRPGLGLRAAFLTDLLSSTGLSGLLMRLRGEGHGQLEVLGPPGTVSFVSSLRHFVHWKHPVVCVSEIRSQLPTTGAGRQDADLYSDEHVDICAVWSNTEQQLSSASEDLPYWLGGGKEERRNSLGGTFVKNEEEIELPDDEEESNDTDSTSTSDGGDSTTSSSSSDGSDNSTSDSDDDDAGDAKADESSLFAALDATFMKEKASSSGSGVRSKALGLLDPKTAKESRSSVPLVLQHLNSTAAAVAAANTAENERNIGGRVYNRFASFGVNLFTQEIEQSDVKFPQNRQLLGYVCHIKASNQVLLIGDCPTWEKFELFTKSAAVRAMANLPPERIAGSVLMLGPGLSRDNRFTTAMTSENHNENRFPAGSVFLMEHPGIGATSSNIGYVSSARTAARLNVVSERMFPLPVPLRESSSFREQQVRKKEGGGLPRNEKPIDRRIVDITRLRKGVWREGKVVLQEEEAKGEMMNGGSNRSEINVKELQNMLFEADLELQSKLDTLKSSANNAGAQKRPREALNNNDEVSANGSADVNNKRAAADLKTRLQEGREGEATAASQSSVPPRPAQLSAPWFRPQPPPPAPPPPPDDPQVTFLGTGSAEPSPHRGASSIHLHIGHKLPGLLLDCGEGCYGQLVRWHGPDQAQTLINSLAAIWVSHRHADHMSGVLQIIAHYSCNAAPLLIVGPHSLGAWLAEAAPAAGLQGRYVFAHCTDVGHPAHWSHTALYTKLGMLGVIPVPVRHCSDAYGIVLRHRSGWSVVYSGDTQPSDALVKAGLGATLLIHEATFEPALEGEARKKRHSTTQEAIEIAQRMKVSSTILTHFSQRYPKFPEGVAEAVQTSDNGSSVSIGVAFDGMQVPFSTLPKLPAITQAVQAVLVAAAAASNGETNTALK